MSTDPDDEQPEQQLGRVYSFRGTELARYAFNHRAALFRLGVLTDYEFCVYLVRLLMIGPKEIDAIREPDAITQFRLTAGEWADREGVSSGKGLDELRKLCDDITSPVKEAESVRPAVKKSQLEASKSQRQKPVRT